MTRSMTNGTKSQGRTGTVLAGSGFGRAITDHHLVAGGALGLLPPVGVR
jgi:hypothetical protein